MKIYPDVTADEIYEFEQGAAVKELTEQLDNGLISRVEYAIQILHAAYIEGLVDSHPNEE